MVLSLVRSAPLRRRTSLRLHELDELARLCLVAAAGLVDRFAYEMKAHN